MVPMFHLTASHKAVAISTKNDSTCTLFCSPAGEHWDQSEEMDTYYNPIPHFTYQMALDHSPPLKNVRCSVHVSSS